VHATLRDVAKAAGVSIKTVSRVVNNQGEISAATRQRVQATIEALGYRPNVIARSLVNRRSQTLAVVTAGLEHYGPQQTVVGVEQECEALGYSLLLDLFNRPDHADADAALDALVVRRVDGIVWAVPEIDGNWAWARPDFLMQLPPIVFLSASVEPQPGLHVVGVDNRNGAAQVTQHLLDQRRRKIGLITGERGWRAACERQAGWEAALRRAGLSPSPDLIATGDWSAASGERGMRQLLEQHPNLDAVFACNDQMAVGALGVIRQAGYRLPEDIALVGFDNIPESAYFWPPLTTVFHRHNEVGHLAVGVLHRLIEASRREESEPAPNMISITPQLVIRQSSGAAQDGR
jgi:LacI family transcriptional regulator